MRKLYIIIFLLIVISNLKAQCFDSRAAFEKYYQQNISNLDQLEGIWSISVSMDLYYYNEFIYSGSKSQTSELAIMKFGSVFRECEIDDDNLFGSIIEFSSTVNPNIYLFKKIFQGDTNTANAVITSNGLLEYSYEAGLNELKFVLKEQYKIGFKLFQNFKWFKVYPIIENLKSIEKTSGTGFAISGNGLIVTCNHVIENTDDIKVRGIDNNFSKTYKAKVITTDKNNDIAIIQIDDPDFKSIDNIPYNLSDKSIDVGSSVFALGYPLRSTMGDEIKLTDGIISAKSGYKGDITSYQISVPVQPGNSGGPLFDENGNIAGIINAKNYLAENASYAVKISYLKNLLETLSLNTDFAVANTLSSKSLPEKVKMVRNFTYIIECN